MKFRGLLPAVKAVLRPAANLVRWFRREHLHAVVMAQGAPQAFGIIGTARWRQRTARIYFGDDRGFVTRVRPHGTTWVPQAETLVARHGLVLVSETPVPDHIAHTLVTVPNWVALSVDLKESEAHFKAAITSSARSDLQRLRRSNVTSDVVRDPAWALEFYRDFHAPAMQHRHGDDAYVMSVQEMADLVRNREAEFVRLSLGGRQVAASLTEVVDGRYFMRRIGWRHDDPAVRRDGVIAALYWHSMQRARALGIRDVQMGATPPFLEDGLFRFKAKWCAALDRTQTIWGSHYLLMAPGHPDMRRALHRRSFIIFDARNEFAVLSASAPQDALTASVVRHTAQWYQLCEQPSAECERANVWLPLSLRPWFRAVPIA